MNLTDITLVAETITDSDIASLNKIFKLKIKASEIEVLNLVDVSVIQTEVSSGNNAIITRACFEYPEKMIKSELQDYSTRASETLELIFEELLSSENKIYSLKSTVTKLL